MLCAPLLIVTVPNVGNGRALLLTRTRGICSQLKIVHHLICAAPQRSWENTSGSDGYVDDLQSNRPSECKTHGAPSRRYGLCCSCFRYEDPGVQRSAQLTADPPKTIAVALESSPIGEGHVFKSRGCHFCQYSSHYLRERLYFFKLKRGWVTR